MSSHEPPQHPDRPDVADETLAYQESDVLLQLLRLGKSATRAQLDEKLV